MNKRQLSCMWLGILLIVLFGVFLFLECYRYRTFWVLTFIVALVTGGLIITFREEKSIDEQDLKGKAMKWRRGLKIITAVLSFGALAFWVIAGIVGTFLEEDLEPLVIGPGIGLACFAGIWVLYGIGRWGIIPIMRWIEKGFEAEVNKPKDEQKQ